MFPSVRKSRDSSKGVSIDMAPLIDVVFILLIFFLVTANFSPDTGIDITRPQASTAQPLNANSLRVSIAASGEIYVDGKVATLTGLTTTVKALIGRAQSRAVIVIPDATVPSSRLVEVIDAARLGGATDVAIGTNRNAQGRAG